MACQDAVPSLNQLRVRGKISAVKRPIRMVIQFFKPLVKTVNRREEGHWIGDVNRDWHVQGGTGFPHRIEARIVNFHQFARGDVFAQIESEGFENLKSTCPIFVGLLDGVGLNSGIVRILEELVAGLGESEETIWMCAIVF